MPGFDLPWRQISKQQDGSSLRETHQRRLQHDGYRFRLRSSSYGGHVAPPILRAVELAAGTEAGEVIHPPQHNCVPPPLAGEGNARGAPPPHSSLLPPPPPSPPH